MNLQVDEMIHVSSFWLSDEKAREVAQQSAVLAPLVPKLQAAHDELVASQPRGADPKLKELTDAASALDAVHDTLLRGIHMLLSALSLLEGEQGEAYLELRDKLMPEGPQLTQRTYEAQAGYAKVVKERVAVGDTKSRLEQIVINDVPLLQRVMDWLDAGERLGKIEAERAARVKPETSIASRVHAARLQWVRLANLLQMLIPHAELDAAGAERLLGPLRKAEEGGDRRAARRAAGDATPKPPEDEGITGDPT